VLRIFGGIYSPNHRKIFSLRFILVLTILEIKYLSQTFEGELKSLTEEAGDERRMAGKGIVKEQDQRLSHCRIETILKKFMSSKMDGWFMSVKEAVLIFSTRIRTTPVLERLILNDEKMLKKGKWRRVY
jgi:hypothetical protein